MLIEPNEKYTKHIETSKHYLNDPKFMLNSDLKSIYQGGGRYFVETYLKSWDFAKPYATSLEFEEEFGAMSMTEFTKINPNTYLDKKVIELPVRAQLTDKRLNREAELAKPIWGWMDWAVGTKYDKRIYQ